LENLLKTFQNLQPKEILEKIEEDKSKEENNVLKKNAHKLKNDITNFVKSTKTFQKIMGSQVSAFDKACMVFKTNHKQKLYEIFFFPEIRLKATNVHIVRNMDILKNFVLKRKKNKLFKIKDTPLKQES